MEKLTVRATMVRKDTITVSWKDGNGNVFTIPCYSYDRMEQEIGMLIDQGYKLVSPIRKALDAGEIISGHCPHYGAYTVYRRNGIDWVLPVEGKECTLKSAIMAGFIIDPGY